jgi:hypothetical protein
MKLQGHLLKKLFTSEDLKNSPQQLLFFHEEGLLFNPIAEGKCFNTVDHLWCMVLSQMEDMNVPIELIRSMKEELFKPYSSLEIKELFNVNSQEIQSALHLSSKDLDLLMDAINMTDDIMDQDSNNFLILLIESILNKASFSLLIFSDGIWMSWFEGYEKLYLSADMDRKESQPYIKIAVSSILKEYLADSRNAFVLPSLNLFNSSELKVMELIQGGEYDKITISFKDRKAKSLELTKTHETSKKIVDVLTDGAYQDIVIKSHKGTVTHIQNTVKIFID